MPTRLLPREAKLRAKGLLDMMYLPEELAEDIGVNVSHVLCVLIPAGLPHTIGADNEIWLHGPGVARWLKEQKPAECKRLRDDEAYCLRCRKVIAFGESITVRHGATSLRKSKCPHCRGGVQRGVKAT